MSILIDSTGQSPYKRSFSFCNYVIISCFLLFGFVLTSCDQETYNAKNIMKEHVGNDGHKWYSYEFENKLGICDDEGNVKVLPKYDSIKYVSDGKFYELKEVVDGDTLLVILDKAFKTLVSRDLHITSYEKCGNKDIDQRFFYDVYSKDKSGETLHGAFDKNWNPIFYPYLHKYPYVNYRYKQYVKGGNVEYFLLTKWIDDRHCLEMPLNFRMDKDGNIILDDNSYKKIIAYHYFTQQKEKSFSNPIARKGGVFVGFLTVSFYKNFIIANNLKYSFYNFSDNDKIYKHIERDSNYDDFEKRLIFDDYDNLSEDYKFVHDDSYSSQYDFEKFFNSIILSR